MWDKAQFETFLQDNPPTQEQQETLALVATKFKLMPMERPWAYIKELQASFDYSKNHTAKATNKTEVDSIHTGPNYVHPLAKNFADFLRLLLACGDVAALEQAWMWDKAQFETFLQDNPPTPG